MSDSLATWCMGMGFVLMLSKGDYNYGYGLLNISCKDKGKKV